MFSSNNKEMNRVRKAKKMPKYGLAKLNVGVASVLLGTGLVFAGGASVAHADVDTLPQDASQATSLAQQNQNSAANSSATSREKAILDAQNTVNQNSSAVASDQALLKSAQAGSSAAAQYSDAVKSASAASDAEVAANTTLTNAQTAKNNAQDKYSNASAAASNANGAWNMWGSSAASSLQARLSAVTDSANAASAAASAAWVKHNTNKQNLADANEVLSNAKTESAKKAAQETVDSYAKLLKHDHIKTLDAAYQQAAGKVNFIKEMLNGQRAWNSNGDKQDFDAMAKDVIAKNSAAAQAQNELAKANSDLVNAKAALATATANANAAWKTLQDIETAAYLHEDSYYTEAIKNAKSAKTAAVVKAQKSGAYNSYISNSNKVKE